MFLLFSSQYHIHFLIILNMCILYMGANHFRIAFDMLTNMKTTYNRWKKIIVITYNCKLDHMKQQNSKICFLLNNMQCFLPKLQLLNTMHIHKLAFATLWESTNLSNRNFLPFVQSNLPKSYERFSYKSF